MRLESNDSNMSWMSSQAPQCQCCSRQRVDARLKWLVIFGLLLVQTAQVTSMTLFQRTPDVGRGSDGDPAPGRSPGPPNGLEVLKVEKTDLRQAITRPESWGYSREPQRRKKDTKPDFVDVNKEFQSNVIKPIESEISSHVEKRESEGERTNQDVFEEERSAEETTPMGDSDEEDSYLVSEFVRNLMKTQEEDGEKEFPITELLLRRPPTPVVAKRTESEAAVSNRGSEVSEDDHNSEGDQPTVILTAEDDVTVNNSWCEEVTRLLTTDDVIMAEQPFNLTLSHPLFRTDLGLVSDVTYKVTISKLSTAATVDYSLSSLVDGRSRGEFTSRWEDATCSGGASSLAGHLSDQNHVSEMNWRVAPPPLNMQDYNVTFRLRYRVNSDSSVAEVQRSFTLLKDCRLWLWPTAGNVSWRELPLRAGDCQLSFSPPAEGSAPRGLVVELTRLNVPCLAGHLLFAERTLCGKLEELPPADRRLYFPDVDPSAAVLRVHRSPVFAFSYRLVDYCYNVTLTKRNDTITLRSNPAGLFCTFKIHLPYGNRVALKLRMISAVLGKAGRTLEDFRLPPTSEHQPITFDEELAHNDYVKPSQAHHYGDVPNQNLNLKQSYNLLFPRTTTPPPFNFFNANDYTDTQLDFAHFAPFHPEPISEEYSDEPEKSSGYNEVLSDVKGLKTLAKDDCSGFLVRVTDGTDRYVYCTPWLGNEVSLVSKGNSLVVQVTGAGANGAYQVVLTYSAEPVAEVTQQCEFGWVAVRRSCLTAVDDLKLSWEEAEGECARRGGHLASVRSDQAQLVVDNVLINSPGYRDHNSYWIGASDRMLEGDFRWMDGQPFSYTNWFPGWAQHGHYNRQPNDDGFSDQDCVEVRRGFHLPASPSATLAPSFMWNDRDCETSNYFLCERLRSGEPAEEGSGTECNRSVVLSREQPRVSVVSPGFPRQYPDNAECETEILAPPDYRLVLDFEELVLEKEPNCSYDYLEISEEEATPGNHSVAPRRLCGDWSTKLKLLRYVSSKPRLRFHFVSDYSHHFGGFKARVSMENAAAVDCGDDRLQLFNRSCYLFVSYPEVTWQTARQICKGLKAELASVHNIQEENFVTTKIRDSSEYSTSAIYWLGGQLTDKWTWVDGTPMTFAGWMYGSIDSGSCLGIQWLSSVTESQPSGLYWRAQGCDYVGGYVCKRDNPVSGSLLSLNRTVNGTEGFLTSPNFPSNYNNDIDYWVDLIGPQRSRIVVTFLRLDLELQEECLYDYLELMSSEDGGDSLRWCGEHGNKSEGMFFVSRGNEVFLHFHSDYSVNDAGFSARWSAVDVSGCPFKILTAHQGTLESPNFPSFLLPHLDCTTTIKAPAGRRVWLEFHVRDLESSPGEASLELDLGGNLALRPFQLPGHLNDGAFMSTAERLTLRLKTGDNPLGRGFSSTYNTVSQGREERVISLSNVSYGFLRHLNFPGPAPNLVDYTERLIVPLGYTIQLEFYSASLVEDCSGCPGNGGMILITDKYADSNGTGWCLCEAEGSQDISIESYLNTLYLRQWSRGIGVKLNATLKVKQDVNYKLKLLHPTEEVNVESCSPNPCMNGGKCVSIGAHRKCQCVGHFTGMFCALTLCEQQPCLFGLCELTANSYTCRCLKGYMGATCDQKTRPCLDNPCEGRGECISRGDSYDCRCYAWWEGPRCDKRILTIPFKPLSQRMLQEPFWLGLITVTIVLGVIGLVWCAKRHFPEKLEKLLAEEADRNRPGAGCSQSRPPSARDQLAAVGAAAAVVVPSPQPSSHPRTFLGRLGIRKPSLLSLTSPQQQTSTTARTFSLDDLLKPPPRRTPSPRKKRNNSTPTKKIADKKQILHQLVTPTPTQRARKMSLVELIQLSEQVSDQDPTEETSFSGAAGAEGAADNEDPVIDAKLEKKVHFARLLSKVSAEISSGSEVEAKAPRSTSTPPSPVGDTRSPHSTSSNQGSDSMSSLEVNHTSLGDFLNQRRGHRLTLPAKNTSADSILAMFRNFSSTSAAPGHHISPSTTPTASSPQDDAVSTSSTSSIPTPLSSSSFALDSPPLRHHHTIEVPVFDAFSGHKTSSSLMNPPTILLEIPSGGQGKCLSPIREVPTPLPSPCPSRSLTPVFRGGSSSSDEPRDKKAAFKNACQIAVDEPIETGMPGPGRPPPPIIPLLVVEQPSPTRHCPGSPPPQRSHPGSPPTQREKINPLRPFEPGGSGKAPRRLLKELDKPTSLDLPCPPPMITVTCNMSETESETESISPTKGGMAHLIVPSLNPGMSYLSPFSMCSRADRTTSESNLSSSGYSSMSPGPSRCGSNNPLCPSESEDQSHSPRKASPLTGTPNTSSSPSPAPRGRSDSETMSDDPFVESNDEGFGTDHLDDRIEDGELKSAKELEVFIGKELLDNGKTILGIPTRASLTLLSPDDSQVLGKLSPKEATVCPTLMPAQVALDLEPTLKSTKCELLDSCVSLVDTGPEQNGVNKLKCFSKRERWLANDKEYWDKVVEKLSAPNGITKSVSLENSNKLSPKGIKKFRSLEGQECYGRPGKDSVDKVDGVEGVNKVLLQLPSIVVEDGSDACEVRTSPVSSRSESPLSDRGRFSPMFFNKLPVTDSEYPSSDGPKPHRKTGRRRERKPRATSLNTPVHVRPSPRGAESNNSPTTGHLLDVPGKEHQPPHRKPSPKRSRVRSAPLVSSSSSSESLTSTREMRAPEKKGQRSREASGEDTGEELTSQILPKSNREELPRPHKKISRLRTISHQIRFLRRIEQSLKRRERLVSPSDSCEEDRDPPMHKSSSSTELNAQGHELLIPKGERGWRKVAITGNPSGHTD